MLNHVLSRTAASLWCAAALLYAPFAGARQDAAKQPTLFSMPVERCILPAASFHGINHFVLRAVLQVESRLNPNAVGRNPNGSIDLGIGQMNSIHFKELAEYGVTPSHLRDACIGTYVAAWHLAKSIHRNGNTWQGIATYHSRTPYFNRRYQALLFNELVRSGVIQGRALPVSPLAQAK